LLSQKDTEGKNLSKAWTIDFWDFKGGKKASMILPHISEITGHEISSAITKGALQREDVISFSCLLVLCHYFRLAGRR